MFDAPPIVFSSTIQNAPRNTMKITLCSRVGQNNPRYRRNRPEDLDDGKYGSECSATDRHRQTERYADELSDHEADPDPLEALEPAVPVLFRNQ